MFKWSPPSSPKAGNANARLSISKLLLGWLDDDPAEEPRFPQPFFPDPRYLTDSDGDIGPGLSGLTPCALNTSPEEIESDLSSLGLFASSSSNHSSTEYTDLDFIEEDFATRIESVIKKFPNSPQDIEVRISHERISFLFEEQPEKEGYLIVMLAKLFDDIENCTPPGTDLLSDQLSGYTRALHILYASSLEMIVDMLEKKTNVATCIEQLDKETIEIIGSPRSGPLTCFHL